MEEMTRVSLLLLLVLMGCHQGPDALQVRVQVPEGLKASCIELEVSSDAQDPQLKRILRPDKRGEVLVAVFQGDLPTDIRLQARALWGSGCEGALKSNGRSQAIGAQFVPEKVPSVTLALPGPRSAGDKDGDGFIAEDQEGSDCDDTLEAVHPDVQEVCDASADLNCDKARGCADTTCPAVCAWVPTRLVVEGLEPAITGACAGPVSVTRTDEEGHPAAPGFATPFNLASTFPPDVVLYSNPSCTSPPDAYSIPAGYASFFFYVKAYRPLTGKFAASSEGIQEGALSRSFVSGPTDTLAFTTPPLTPVAGECLPLGIMRNNAYGQPVTGPVESFTVVLPEQSQGALYPDAACKADPLPNVTFAGKDSSLMLYFRGTRAGPVEVKLTNGVAQGKQVQTVKAGPATKLMLSPADGQRLVVGECSSPVTARVADMFDNPVPFAAANNLNLSASSGGGFTFHTDDRCQGAAVTKAPFAAGSAETTFRFKGANAATVEVTATVSSYSLKQTHTVAPLVRRATCALEVDAMSTDCAITPPLASRERAFFFFQATTPAGANAPDSAFVQCALRDVSTLTCSRKAGTVKVNINWQVVELAKGLRVQHSVQRCSGAPTLVPIEPVDMTKSFVLFSAAQIGGNVDNDDFATAVLKTSTSVEVGLASGACGANNEYSLQVVQWDGVSVTRGVAGPMITDSMDVNDLPSVADPAHAIVLSTHQTVASGTPNICDRLVRGEATNATSLRFTRGAGATGTSCIGAAVPAIAWERLVLLPGASVQKGVLTINNGNTTNTPSLGSPVDPNRTVLFTSSQAHGGQGSGETTHAADDVPGVASVRLDFNSSSQPRLTRDSNLGTSKWTVYVLQLEP